MLPLPGTLGRRSGPVRPAAGPPFPKRPPSPGWVDLGNMILPHRRRIDDGYLRQRLAQDHPIGYNQAYVRKVLENPHFPECNRRAVVAFVRDHPEYDQWVDGYNGNAVDGFVQEILKRFG